MNNKTIKIEFDIKKFLFGIITLIAFLGFVGGIVCAIVVWWNYDFSYNTIVGLILVEAFSLGLGHFSHLLSCKFNKPCKETKLNTENL